MFLYIDLRGGMTVIRQVSLNGAKTVLSFHDEGEKNVLKAVYVKKPLQKLIQS